MLLLCQLSRRVEERANRRPLLSDLRDAGQIEQDADTVILLYRDRYYDENSPYGDIAEINVAKQRHGATGVIPALFNREQVTFVDYGGEWPLAIEQPRTKPRGFSG